MKINILDEVIANQIAAGEVVERSQSVVKELIENSLDSGADEIDISITSGGLGSIIITDNGCGMAAPDAVLCFSRYATSKLKVFEDLHSMQTFGFRGEALASIASVSKVRLITREHNADIATEVTIEGGKIVHVGEAGSKIGTRIEIRDLFYNVPARRKFLRGERSEEAAIEDVIRSMALFAPTVRFSLTIDNKLVVNLAKCKPEAALNDEQRQERAIVCLGKDVRGYLYSIEAQTSSIALNGYIVAPLITRRSNKGMRVYINGRIVEDREFYSVIKVAFRTLLEVGRQPICALHIHVDTDLVDVNVHPQKKLVRFSEPQMIYGSVIKILSEFLAKTPWSPENYIQSNTRSDDLLPRPTQWGEGQRVETNRVMNSQSPLSLDPSPRVAGRGELREGYIPAINIQTLPIKRNSYANCRVIGQVDNTFLLLESDNSLIALDQHAAHERVLFERFVQQLKAQGVEMEQTLFPVQIQVTHNEIAALEEHKNLLLSFGFDCEPFGESIVRMRAKPVGISLKAAEEVVKDALQELAAQGREDVLTELTDKLCALLACHGSVRKGQKLSDDEIRSLLASMGEIDFSAHCPHGRPVVRVVPFTEMASWFHRG